MTDGKRRRPLREILDESYRGRRVLITGHNGFVGTWLSYWLAKSGAIVLGVALPPEERGMARQIELDGDLTSLQIDIRDYALLSEAIRQSEPDVVFHLAAQALVLPSFEDPLGTFATNVMGTAHLLEAIRHQPSVHACVVVTSDKCYATSDHAHSENDPLGGDDPYSASKAGAEIVLHAYRSSFLVDGPRVASARAGNIVGGGDWAMHRIIPDCMRAVLNNEAVQLRQPSAIRPWQHVLDAVAGYLRLGDALITGEASACESWNFGPLPEAAVTVSEVVNLVVEAWNALGGNALSPTIDAVTSIQERAYLTLESSKARTRLDWEPLLDLPATIEWTVDWYYSSISGRGAADATARQLSNYLELDAEFSRPMGQT